MPRDMVLGNGTLSVNIDRNLNIRDLYYPHVGFHNHLGGRCNMIGVWTDEQFAWIDDTWSVRLGYVPGTLTTDAMACNGRLGVRMYFNDTVHPEYNLLLRKVTLENLYPEEREIRVFFNHDFRIQQSDVDNTVFYHPFTGAVVHYKRESHILINGRASKEGAGQYTIGSPGMSTAGETWRDAEDGLLNMNSVGQGATDSTVGFSLRVPGRSTSRLEYWIAVGCSLEDVLQLNATVRGETFDVLAAESESHWHSWVELRPSWAPELRMSQGWREIYERSLLVIRNHVDRTGGIIATTDSDVTTMRQAGCGYIRPRDAAFAARSLDMAGYGVPARGLFSFCAALLSGTKPFLLQSYGADGTLGPTSLPWLSDGTPEVPCGLDGTAAVLWAVGEHYERWKDKEFVESIYEDLVAPAADYMVRALDTATNLPRPSYDLWEQRRGIHLFTCCAVFGALSAAANLASTFDPSSFDHYWKARNRLKKAITDSFYKRPAKRFVRSLVPVDGGPGAFEPDMTIDSAMMGPFIFGVLPPGHPKIGATMRAVYDRLWVNTPVGGIARYEDDRNFQISSDTEHIPGNPWFVPTLWMAEWYIAVAQGFRDLEPAHDLIEWAVANASPSGMLAEQIHPFTGKPLTAMPFTWSHASLVSTMSAYERKSVDLLTSRVDRT